MEKMIDFGNRVGRIGVGVAGFVLSSLKLVLFNGAVRYVRRLRLT
jgi:hypothetical protein